MGIKENYNEIVERVKRNAIVPASIVAVTKTVDTDRMILAAEAGATVFGENRVQEILEKYEKIEKKCKISWHLIGQLQTNKVKYIIDKVDLIHSLDRASLAEEIERQCRLKNLSANCLIQVNIAKEDTKSGVYEEDIDELIRVISAMEHINIKGLMAIAPYSPNPEDVRVHFANMKKLFDRLKENETERFEMKYLSMGMSGDFEVALQEGANMVRVGSAIFGDRQY